MLKKPSLSFLEYENVIKEFSGITNDQAYVKIFSERMLKPIPGRIGEFFGTDQRLQFIPSLKQLISNLAGKPNILDVGGGAGDIVDFAFRYAPAGTIINVEEPNPILIQSYVRKIHNHPCLKVGKVYEGPLQDLYARRRSEYRANSQSLITAVHMIYHLTDYTDPKSNPKKDLSDAVAFLYNLLEPGGSLFIVYADLINNPDGEAVCGIAEKYFKLNFPQSGLGERLGAVYAARNELLGPHGTISSLLEEKFDDSTPILISERKESHFFGESIADIAVLALAAELCPSDEEPFDINKLKFCLDYISQNPERVGLVKEEGDVPQKGMWRANEPQVVATITKGVAGF